MRFIPIIFLTTLSHLCFGQVNDEQTFLDNSYNKKAVKENKIDSVIEKVQLHNNNKQIRRLFSFDNLGNLTYFVTTNEKGNKTSETVLKYNNRGQLISRKDKEEMIDNNSSYSYNKNDQLDKVITVNKDGETITVTYVYDGQNLIEEKRKENSSQLLTKYKYDNNRHLIDLTTLTFIGSDTKGAVALHKSIFYDSKGNKSLENVEFFKNDTITYKNDESNKLALVKKGKDTEKMFYNDNGLLIKKEVTKFFMDRRSSYTEFYEYKIRK